MASTSGTGLTPALIAAFEEQKKHPGETRAPFVFATKAPMLALSTIAICLRLYARKKTRTKFAWDDVTAILAWVFAAAIVILSMAFSGLTQHLVFLKRSKLELALRALYASQYLWNFATILYKTSILLYLDRIFTLRNTRTAIVLRTTLALIWTTCFVGVIVLALECRPISHAWKLLSEGKCINTSQFFLASAIIGVIFDAIIIIIPLPLIWRLHLSLSKRLSITGVFLLGSLVLVCSIMRATYIRYLELGIGTFDPLWDNVIPGTWTAAELNLGVICACLPSIWPLFIRAKKRVGNYSSQKRTGGSSNLSHGRTRTPVSSHKWRSRFTSSGTKDSDATLLDSFVSPPEPIYKKTSIYQTSAPLELDARLHHREGSFV